MFFRIFRALMPKEEKFLELFALHAEKGVLAAKALDDLMAEGADMAACFKRVCQIEGEADAITRQTLQALHRSFITPFDREQIHTLITSMDNTIDGIEDVAQRIDLYGIKTFTDDMRQLAHGIVECSSLLAEAIPLLAKITPNAETINKLCDAIGKIESKADKCQRQGLRNLFATEKDPVTLIGRKEIYQRLEKVSDRFDDVANVIETIVIEHV